MSKEQIHSFISWFLLLSCLIMSKASKKRTKQDAVVATTVAEDTVVDETTRMTGMTDAEFQMVDHTDATIPDEVKDPDLKKHKPAQFDNIKIPDTVVHTNETVFKPLSEMRKEIEQEEEETKETTSTALVVATTETTVTKPKWEAPPPPKVILEINGKTIHFTSIEHYQKTVETLVYQQIGRNRLGALTPGERFLLEDVAAGRCRYWRWFPPSGLHFWDASFKTESYGLIPAVGCKCPSLQPGVDNVVIESPILRIYFCKLFPLGNYHPRGENYQKKSLGDAFNMLQACLRDSDIHPEFNAEMQDHRAWKEQVRKLMLEWACWCPDFKPYDLLKAEGFNPTGSEEERKAYHEAFWSRVRNFYKDDKDGKYPYNYTAKKKLIINCTKEEAKEFEKTPFIAPGNLRILQREFDEELPPMDPKKKDDVQLHHIPVDVPIFEPDASFLAIAKRKELHAYEHKNQNSNSFIDAKHRSTITDGEWATLNETYHVRFKPSDEKTPWSVGMGIGMEAINRKFPADVIQRNYRIFDYVSPDPTKLPVGRLKMSEEREREIITQAMDAALLAFDVENAKEAAKTDVPRLEIAKTE